MCRQTSNTYVKNETKPALVLLIEAIAGKWTPGICKVAKEYCNVVGHTPPYHTELHPMEHVCAILKGGYGRANEATGARNHAETLSECVSEADLTAFVRHCGQTARDIADGERAIVLDDDMAPEVEGAEFPLSGADSGEMPGF